MNNPLIDKLKAAGWHEQRSYYYWQHNDGRKLERADNGKWYLKPVKGRAVHLGEKMKDAFEKVLNG